MNFDRITYKARGKIAFKKAYWLCVLVCFVVMLLTGGFGNGSSGRDNNAGYNVDYNQNGGYTESYDAADMIPSGLDELLPAQGGVPGALANNALSAAAGRFGIPVDLLRGIAGGVIGVLAVLFACLGLVFQLLVSNPIEVGGKRFFMENRGAGSQFGALGYAFKNSYGNIVWTMLKRDLFVFLWTLLFIIPGVIKGYSYMLVPYLLSENPNMDSRRALQLSSELMNGHKSEAFVMDLSFLGWQLLSACTAGLLGIFWVNPYYEASKAELYGAMRGYAQETNRIEAGELPGYSRTGWQPSSTDSNNGPEL